MKRMCLKCAPDMPAMELFSVSEVNKKFQNKSTFYRIFVCITTDLLFLKEK